MEAALRFVRQHKRAMVTIGIAATALIAVVSAWTRMDVDISRLYFVTIGVFAWVCSRRTAVAAALLTAATEIACSALHVQTTWVGAAIEGTLTVGSFVIAAIIVNTFSAMFDNMGHLARFDSLTGVPNAAHFQRLLAAEFRRSRRYERPMTVAFVDVDNFKAVNDSEGHSAGDEVLRAIAGALRNEIRASDVIGRLGGDEFALLLPETGLMHARPLLERVERKIASMAVENGWPISISVGATALPIEADDAWTEQDLLHYADTLMYRAKKEGKGRVVAGWYSPDRPAPSRIDLASTA